MGVFDQYNQSKLGPENDYQQALGLLGKGGGGNSVQMPSYDKGSQAPADWSKVGSQLFGSKNSDFGDQLSMAPEAAGGPSTPGNIPSGGSMQTSPSLGQPPMSPESAMGMVAPKSNASVQFPNYDKGGGGGGGGGMSADSLSSIASMFI